MNYESAINMVMSNLEKHLSTKTIIGEPITMGDVTLIPVMDLMFGYGGGLGEGKDEKNNNGGGAGGGGGARLSPKAVIVIKNGQVEVLPLVRGGAIEKIVEAIPGLLEKFQTSKAAKAEAAAAEMEAE